MAGFTHHFDQAGIGVVDARHHFVEQLLGNRRVAAIAVQLHLVTIQLFEQVGFQVGAGGDIHDLENGDQGEMVIEWRVAGHQLTEAVKQMLQSQHRADALVEWVLVKNQDGHPLSVSVDRKRALSAPRKS